MGVANVANFFVEISGKRFVNKAEAAEWQGLP